MNDHPKLSRRKFMRKTIKTGTLLYTASSTLGSISPLADEQQKDPWQIGCFTRPWAHFEYKTALDEMVKAGYKYAGMMTDKSGQLITYSITDERAMEIRDEVKKRNLSILCTYGGNFGVEKSVEAGIKNLHRLIDLCVIIQSKSLMLGGTGESLYKAYYKAIRESCPYAAEKKVGLVMKPHGGSNSTGPQCRKAIESVNHPNFTLWYDPGNIFYYSKGTLDPVDDASSVDGIVTGMCVKDYLPPQNVMVTPGKGKVHFAEVMKKLKAGGFTHGPLLIETLAQGDLAFLQNEATATRHFVEKFVNA